MTSNYHSGPAYKESGLLKAWTHKLLVYDPLNKILTVSDIKAKTNKTLELSRYTLKNLGLYNGKYTLYFKSSEVEPRVAKFGWKLISDSEDWFHKFTDIPFNHSIERPPGRKQDQEQWQNIEQEKIETEVQLQVPVKLPKPSHISRIRTIIKTLPSFLQNDFQIILENTLDNLQGFTDIHNLKCTVQKENITVYQDPNDRFHMKVIIHSKTAPQRIYDELVLPSAAHHWNVNLVNLQIFPTKKDCAIFFAEFQIPQPSQTEYKKNLSAKDMDLNELVQAPPIKGSSQDGAKTITIKSVFTQKNFASDEIYCVIRKYTGDEVKHNQIDHIEGLDQYIIKRGVILIQKSNKPNFLSQIIEDVYIECIDSRVGEELTKLMLLSLENIDLMLQKAEKIIEKETENIIVKNENNLETLQISFKDEQPRITSEQHQIQSKNEYLNLLQLAKGQNTINCINHYTNLNIIAGLNQQLQTNQDDGHYILGKYYIQEPSRGGLLYTNKKLVSDQRKVIFDMVKRMGSNLLSGKSIMSVSLPIQIFESRSFLERMARSFGHAPLFLEPAAQSSDPVEIMKSIIAFCMSSFLMGIQQEKPFNPIIGETFQGRLKGCPVYLEQISHHPPISNFIMYGRGYKYYGALCPVVNLGTNSIAGEQQGHPIFYFEALNLKFYYIWQPFTIYNISIGQRNVNCQKRSFCFQPDHQLLCQIQFNPKDKNAGFFSKGTQKIDYFEGKIIKCSKDFIDRCLVAHKFNSGKVQKLKLEQQDILEVYSKVTGRWTQYCDVDGKRYWDIDQHRPYILELEVNPLPSDSLYREDLLYMKMKDMVKGQSMKEDMEVFQRKDKERRDKYKKKYKL